MSLSMSSSSAAAAASTPKSSSSPAAASSTTSWFSGIVRGRGDKPNPAKLSKSASATGIGSGDYGGPIKGKNQFRGVLFKYGPKSIQVAFKTGEYKQQVIFIGGLTDGLLATDYLEPLAIALDKEKWSLVQLLMSSSYSGFGTSSLKQDAQEIDQLISYLINKENSEGVVLLGHSTGCQDIVYYMGTNAACSRAVRAAILQAPVSDREYKATLPETPAMIDLAANMIKEGRAEELMPREADPSAPISAYRYHSLCARGDRPSKSPEVFLSLSPSSSSLILQQSMALHRFFFLFSLTLLTTTTLSLSLSTVYDLLPKYGLPSGLLPDSVTNFTLSDDGRFVVRLARSCSIEFDYLVRYEKTVSGRISYGSITELEGIQVKRLFIWLDVDEIKVDLPPTDSIYFKVGFINKKLGIDQFKTVHSCGGSGSCGGSWKSFLQLPGMMNEAEMLITE